jgi:DNA-binding NtrC family response regulator
MKVLIVDDAEDVRLMAESLVERAGHRAWTAEDGTIGLEMIPEVSPDVVLCDLMMPGLNGIELTERALKRWPSLPIIMVTAHASIGTAVRALKAGAFDYLTKPLNHDELLHTLSKVGQQVALEKENAKLRTQLRGYQQSTDYLTNSPRIRAILQQLERIAASDATVLLTGENGTGKEVMARYVQRHSPRADRPFVTVNCSALSEALLESELFGHAKGAFTGAHQDRQGYFEAADSGTLFLDEIGDLSQALQVKLLRVLQERRFSRVGETSVREVDVRLITATNRDLDRLIAEEKVREDFYYRINVFRVELPPLRERPEDIGFLFGLFIEEFAAQSNKRITGVAPETLRRLESYRWPGNIRELRNAAERAAILCPGETIEPDALAEELPATPAGVADGSDYKTAKKAFEIAFITRHLELHGGNMAATARQIGVHAVALRQKVARLGIDIAEIRARSQ